MNNACMLSAPKKTDFMSKVSEGKKNKINNNNSDKFKEKFEKLLNEENAVDKDSNVTSNTEDQLHVVENKETTKGQNKVNSNETLNISFEELQEDNETVIIMESPFIVNSIANNEVDTSLTTNDYINGTNDIIVNEAEIEITHYQENSLLNITNTDKTEVSIDTKNSEIYFESTSTQLENLNVLHVNNTEVNNLNVKNTKEKLNEEIVNKENNLIKPETTNTLINNKLNVDQEGNTFKLDEGLLSKEVELSGKESETKDSLTKKNASNEFDILLNSNEESNSAKIEGLKEANTGFDLLQDNVVLKSNNTVETITNDSSDFLDEVTDKEFSIIQQMAKNITTSKLENGSKITVKLKPEYLGEMTISIENDHNSLVAKISSGREDIKRILNSKVDEISSLLSQKMIKVDKIIVDSIQQDGHMDSNTGHEAGRENMFGRNFAQQNNNSNRNSNNVNLLENESIKEYDLNETNSKDGINYYV